MKQVRKLSKEDLIWEIRLRSLHDLDWDTAPNQLSAVQVLARKNQFSQLNPSLHNVSTKEIFNVKGLWGKDDRKDTHYVPKWKVRPKRRQNFNAVCLFVPAENLTEASSGYNLATEPLHERKFRLRGGKLEHLLYPDLKVNKFLGQPSCKGSFSGFLTSQQRVLTAGHSLWDKNENSFISDSDLENKYRIIFGYQADQFGAITTFFNFDQVFIPSKIHTANYDGGHLSENDWAFVELDRPVMGISPVDKPVNVSPLEDMEIYVVGHPLGLAKKFAGKAKIARINAFYFAGTLDTFGGNSGSPVFDKETDSLLGMLVRGEPDFCPDNNGYLRPFPSQYGPQFGEECQHVSHLVQHF